MPLRATEAKKLIRRLLDGGVFNASEKHAREEMEKDGLTDVDAVNILRGGIVQEAEFEKGSWRHAVRTPRMVFVVTFEPEVHVLPGEDEDVSEMVLVVVTAWRVRS